MSYFDTRISDQQIRESPVESKAFGLRIGRMNVSRSGVLDLERIMERIRNSGMDLVILRIPSQLNDIATYLACEDFSSTQVDTLIYFEGPSFTHPNMKSTMRLEKVSAQKSHRALQMIEDIFHGYRNHYSANPSLRKVSVVSAYQDWLSSTLNSKETNAYFSIDESGNEVGLCLLDEEEDSYHEVLLAGILVEHRRSGNYQKMLRAIQAHADQSSRESVAISTQSFNVSAMRAWCRAGFLPTISMNTFHIQRRDTLRGHSD